MFTEKYKTIYLYKILNHKRILRRGKCDISINPIGENNEEINKLTLK